MRAITYSAFGPADDVLSLGDLPTPDPAPGEVLVEVQYSGVNPSDVKARAGSRPGITKPPFPVIVPHSDGSGTIVAVGEGVAGDRVGQRVWIWNGQWRRPFGTCATHIALPAAQAVPLPEGVDLATGAALGIPGLTAALAVFADGDVLSRTVLVQGGAGTVSYLAVQLAKWGGARVIATARPDDHARVTAAGADAVIDYADDALAERLIAANDGRPIDRIVEVEYGRNAALDAEVIAENGTIAAYGSALDLTPTLPFGPMLFKAVTLDILLIYLLPPAPRAAMITRLHDALGAGALTCPVDATFTLADTAAAHRSVEAGRRTGCTLVEVGA